MIFGFIILGIGVLYLLEMLIPAFSLDYDILWPIILIVISIYMIFKNKKVDFTSLIFMFLGAWFLLFNLDLIPISLVKLFWPLLLIIAGLSIIISTRGFRKKINKGVAFRDRDGILTFHGIFSGVEEKVSEKDFKGAIIYSIFGGSEISFSDVELKADSAEILVYSIFGGTELTLPTGYNIKVNSTAIFGSTENKNKNEEKKGQKTLYINCISIFGGSELR